MSARLSEYKRKRSFDETPEPVGGSGAKGASSGRFVVQQHNATSLHWDLRLERNGALASWALPRGVPLDPDDDRLAVHTEDHPLEYLDFHGTIPEGQYGAGEMSIWDRGTYEAEKFEDGKVVARFDGERMRGRYSLFRIRKRGERSDSWLIHRMDPPPEGWGPVPERVEPMLASEGALPDEDGGWGFEILWSGLRTIARARPGDLALLSAEGESFEALFPEVKRAARSLGSAEALLDGVLVAFDGDGNPDRERLLGRLKSASDSTVRRRARTTPAALVLFDVLHLDGRNLLGEHYSERRTALARLALDGDVLQAPAHHVGDGAALLAAAGHRGLHGVVAKRLDSAYEPGAITADWLRVEVGEG